MASSNVQSRGVWALARRQHGVITHEQLRRLGFGAQAIQHRLRTGRLHRVHRGVYAVGARRLGSRGRLMAAVLACEPGAWISHDSAGWFYRLLDEPLEIHVDAGPTWRWGGASVARPTHVQAHSLAARTALPPDRSLVVETDSLRYHRTATQQTKDMLRDQRHTAAGLTCLRFSHYQVAHERDYVRATLTTVARRLQPAGLAYGV